jgi:hypothetical protein
MFEEAARLRLRFDTPRGSITTEDLWSLPLEASDGMSLDDLARGLSREISQHEQSFVNREPRSNFPLTLKFNIVKRVIEVKLDEITAKEKAEERKRLKEKIMAIIEEKQDASLKNKSLASLQKMLDDL